MTPRKDSIPHEARTAAEPRQNKLYTVRLACVEQVNPSVRLLRLALPQEASSADETAFDSQYQEIFSFLPGQWLDVHVPGIPQAGGFTITSTPADAQPLPIPDPTIIQDGTDQLAHQQSEFGVSSAGLDGRYPYVELAIQDSPSNPPAAWLWKPHSQILGVDLRVRVGGSFVWPPASVRTDQIHKVVFVAGGVGINPLISILSHLTEEQASGPTISLPEKSFDHPLHIRFLYSTRVPSSVPDETTLDQVLFLSRLRNIVQRTRIVTKQPRNIKLDLELFLTNITSPTAVSKAGEILNKVNDNGSVDDSPLIRVHGRRINKDDLDAQTSEQNNDTVYYICGPPPMTDEFVQFLEPIVGKESVLYEKWW
ncbi:conserved hypothetical protein [Talaromyces stipitatus ATCC 10500]|uniref:FAD-binding FR-type domain-containing protein n=1 Tax=Talaromyces stipitatus (strain ATCC 10500 / CBS 375.48 / QM 6759 / NRRL 1006) TaxID=441959 RepID=B8LXK4_TALSN|nr:uncharacterized protein TSTA_078610 [Talaromyces stipitatus ATCC 10500]EED24505.1 conserved hypothetical protein [Talaromyces stipitatus ATCC 10500]